MDQTTRRPAPSAAPSGGTSATPAYRSSSTESRSSGAVTTAAGKAEAALTPRLIDLITARGIDVELAAKLGCAASDRLPGDCLAIPYFEKGVVVNHKYRTLGETKRFAQDANARKIFWNVDCLSDESLSDQPVIITEGEFDAMAAMQAGYQRVLSVPDGAPPEEVANIESSRKYSYIDEAEGLLREVREIILAVDADGPGANLLHDLSVRLGRHRCKWVRYPKDCKDLNDALKAYGTKGVVAAIDRAQWCKVGGVYRMSELPPLPTPHAFDCGMVNLAAHYKLRLGDFCVITGIPGHGKSSFINEVCGRMALSHGWSTAFASFEQRPQIDHRRNLRTFYNLKKVKYQSHEETAKADAWIDKHFSFLVPDEDDEVNLTWALERCAASIIQHGVKIVVIDPWNEMDHVRPADMSLTEYTGFAIKQFRKLAKKYQVHVIVAAHPAKQKKGEDGNILMPSLYDISDSAHWYNKADIGIVVHKRGKITENRAIIRIAKSRYHDDIGTPGEIEAIWNPEACRYTVIEDVNHSEAA